MIQYRLTRHYSGPGGPLQPGVHDMDPMLQNRLLLMGLLERVEDKPAKPVTKKRRSNKA